MLTLTKLTCPLVFIFSLFNLIALGQQVPPQHQHNNTPDAILRLQQLSHAPITNNNPEVIRRVGNIKQQLQINSSFSYKPLGKLDCIDTSSRFFIKTDTATFYGGTPVRTADGNLLISGNWSCHSNGISAEKGFLMKTDNYGTVLWTKLYDSIGHTAYSFINYYTVIELKDGSILLAGSTSTNNNFNIEADFILTKTGNTGNITWSKTFTSRIWGTGFADHFAVQQMKEDNFNGDLYITGSNRTQGYNIIRLNSANGTILWSKLYQPPFGGFNNNPFGIDIGPVEIHSFACFQTNSGSYINAYRINKITGDTLQAKYYQVGNAYATPLTFFVPDPMVTLTNGNYALSGSLWGYRHYGNGDDNDPYYQAGVVQMDKDLNFVNAYCFRNNVNVDSYSKTTIYPDGTGICHMMQVPLTNFYGQTTYSVQFDNGTILKQRKAHHLNEGYHNNNGWLRLPDGGEISVLTAFDSINNTSELLFTKLHLTDTASECLGVNDNSTFTEPYQIQFLPGAYMDSIGNNVFQEVVPNKTITAENFITRLQTPACNQVSFCDTFVMKTSADSVCLFIPVNISIAKRRACGSEPFFNFDSSVVQSFTRLNDSIYTVIFKAAWKGKIYGSIAGCRLLTDSVTLTVLDAPPVLNLGADTLLCNGGSIVLHAGKGYKNYLWQDGTTDSTLTVIKPGTYYVVAENPCSGIFKDTIVVTGHPVISFNLGADTALCPGNTIVLHAPDGYQDYLWQNGDVDSVFIVRAPGIYYVTVQNVCTAPFTDTISVFNHPPIAFDMGPDLSVCDNDTIFIKAPAGFISYHWSPAYNISDTISQTVIVHPLVDTSYKVIAEKTPGCFAYDTIRISIKKSLPVQLGDDKSLCAGDSTLLNAGSGFVQYQWSNGIAAQQIYVYTKGDYSVIGTTAEGCKSYDTLRIVNVWAKPVLSLDRNSTLCTGSTRTLQPGNYSTYLWQDGSTSSSFTINNLGTYFVNVTDNHQCQGSDTVRIISLFPVPEKFLPPDTAVCLYGKIIATTNQTFTSYLWSNGETSPSITITQPGFYWMQATDKNFCTGRDSIRVLPKECAVGLYVPTAFSPNHDGKNDVFRPLLFGNVISFQCTIYNRFGQIIFTTTDPSKGWDGTVKRVPQNSGNFVWVCRYQFAGETEQVTKGSVILLR